VCDKGKRKKKIMEKFYKKLGNLIFLEIWLGKISGHESQGMTRVSRKLKQVNQGEWLCEMTCLN